MSLLLLSRSSVFLKSVVHFQRSYMTSSSVCCRWSFPSLGKFLHDFRDTTPLIFLLPLWSLFLSLLTCPCPLLDPGTAGLFSLSSPSMLSSLEYHPVLFALSTIYMLMTLKFIFPAQNSSPYFCNQQLLHISTWESNRRC